MESAERRATTTSSHEDVDRCRYDSIDADCHKTNINHDNNDDDDDEDDDDDDHDVTVLARNIVNRSVTA